MQEKNPRYTFRKLSIGLASVMVGTTIILTSNTVKAAETAQNTDFETEKVVNNEKADPDKEKPVMPVVSDQAKAETTEEKGTSAKLDMASEKVVADNKVTAETTEKSKSIYKDQSNTEESQKVSNGEMNVYFTVKGKDGQVYATSILSDNNKGTDVIDMSQVDMDSLELHFEYTSSTENKPLIDLMFENQPLQIDSSRLDDPEKGPELVDQNGKEYQYTVTETNKGDYQSYADYLKSRNNDTSKLTKIYLNTDFVGKGSTVTLVIPVTYTGADNGEVDLSYWDFQNWHYGNAALKVKFKDQVQTYEEPAKPTTSGTGIINDQVNDMSSGLTQIANGQVGTYFTAKDKTGNTYVSSYLEHGINTDIFNNADLDLSTLELHINYVATKDGYAMYDVQWDGQPLQIDESRITNPNGPLLVDQNGNAYNYNIAASNDWEYLSYADFAKKHGVANAAKVYLNGAFMKAGTKASLTIPVKVTKNVTYVNLHATDFNTYKDTGSMSLLFSNPLGTTADFDSHIYLGEFAGVDQNNNAVWIYNEELSQILADNGIDLNSIYSAVHAPELGPTGTNDSQLYFDEEYYSLDLTKIEQIISKHGYTVEFDTTSAHNPNSRYLYMYSAGGFAAKIVDQNNNPINIAKIPFYISIVPAITLNKDQTVLGHQEGGEWDPFQTNGEDALLNHAYDASVATGSAIKHENLPSIDPKNLQVSYTYQTDANSAAVSVDKVDLSKAGIYTITYSYTYHHQLISNTGQVTVLPVLKTTEQKVVEGETVAADQAVLNPADFPENTNFVWETTPDTSKASKQAIEAVVLAKDEAGKTIGKGTVKITVLPKPVVPDKPADNNTAGTKPDGDQNDPSNSNNIDTNTANTTSTNVSDTEHLVINPDEPEHSNSGTSSQGPKNPDVHDETTTTSTTSTHKLTIKTTNAKKVKKQLRLLADGKTNKVESGNVINKSSELPATGEKTSNTLFAGISLIFASLISMFELIFDRKKN